MPKVDVIMKQRNPPAAACLLITAMLTAWCLPSRAVWADAFTPAQRAEIVQILRQALQQDPSILRDAVEAMQVDAARKKHEAARAAMAAEHGALFDAKDPVGGNPRGDVTIV